VPLPFVLQARLILGKNHAYNGAKGNGGAPSCINGEQNQQTSLRDSETPGD
jgi:hypothetical protein